MFDRLYGARPLGGRELQGNEGAEAVALQLPSPAVRGYEPINITTLKNGRTPALY
jgi:hypothetical protein